MFLKKKSAGKKKKSSPSLPVSHIHYTNIIIIIIINNNNKKRLLQKKPKKRLTCVVLNKRRDLYLLLTSSYFSLSRSCFYTCVMIIQQIYVYTLVCHYWLNPHWWLCLQCRLNTLLTGARQKNEKMWKKRNEKKLLIMNFHT